MAAKAVFDLAGESGGQVYIFERGDGRLRERLPFDLAEGRQFRIQGLPGDIEESCLSLPLGMLDFRVLELELEDIDKIRAVLPFELEGIILGDPAEVVYDAKVLGSANGKQKVLAVYANKAQLRSLLEGLRALDVDPRSVTSIDLASALQSYRSVGELSSMLLEHRVQEEEMRLQGALAEATHSTVNLRMGEFSYAGESEKVRRSLRFTAAAFALVMLLVAGDFGLKTYVLNKEARGVESGILSVYGEIFPGENPASAAGLTYKIKSRLREMQDQADFVSGVAPLDFLLELERRKVSGLVYTEITLAREGISLKGEASALGQVEEAKAKLEGILSDVTISDTGRSARDKILFTITAKGRKG
jgi:hypothetical protein